MHGHNNTIPEMLLPFYKEQLTETQEAFKYPSQTLRAQAGEKKESRDIKVVKNTIVFVTKGSIHSNLSSVNSSAGS